MSTDKARKAGFANGAIARAKHDRPTKECIRLHVDCGLGVKAISGRIGYGKPTCRRWLIRAGVYNPKRPRKSYDKRTISRSILRDYLATEKILRKTDDCQHWGAYWGAKWLAYKRYHENIHERRSQARDSARKRWKSGLPLQERLKKLCRTRIFKAIRSQLCEPVITKHARTHELIGCDIKSLMTHLESTFTSGMSWSNYGRWHIDHIKPCSQFDLSIKEEQFKCFHFSNLQALWSWDNLQKSDKWKPNSTCSV